MANPYFAIERISRGNGRSAVLAAAYRHRARMTLHREGHTVDYAETRDLAHEEFALPSNAPDWLRLLVESNTAPTASELFWNKVEARETRPDSELAWELIIALPIELSLNQKISLVREFVKQHVTASGKIADWVLHNKEGNPHVHIMMTLRPLVENGFGRKRVTVLQPDGKPLRDKAGKIVYDRWAGNKVDFEAVRAGWFACYNKHLALAGLDIFVDGRSFEKQGIELMPTVHLGAGIAAVKRRTDRSGQPTKSGRLALQEERRAENLRRIRTNPSIVLDLISREKSVFDERDVAKVLARYTDDPDLFRNLMARILLDPAIVCLARPHIDLATGEKALPRYTTRSLVRLEAKMMNEAIWLAQRSSHGLRQSALEASFTANQTISDEQKAAIQHITQAGRAAILIGRAGAGKTTMMAAARLAWEASGFRVVGGALAGKAAEELEREAGIPSRTIAAWEMRWRQATDTLDQNCVFVLDEAGMVSSRQMAMLTETVVRSGAKLVLIGDPDQLQPIEAGAAFRAIADRLGYAELDTIYRQRLAWMRAASVDLALGEIGKALSAYRDNHAVFADDLKSQAITHLIADWDREFDSEKTILILAHLRRDVRMLNEMARKKLVERGCLTEGEAFGTADGVRRFAIGDQIVFLQNSVPLGVKNGTLGRVVSAQRGEFVAEIAGHGNNRRVTVQQRSYNHVDYGYATTVHKSQGATVDRVKVLASLSLDRHLAYVSMTRHRDDLAIYYGAKSFSQAGGLIKVLSRRRAKETTLDYDETDLYRRALRFAEARGFDLIRTARALIRDRVEWTLRQKQKLLDLKTRLTTAAEKFEFARGIAARLTPDKATELKPMVSATERFPVSFEDAIERKLARDERLKALWLTVSARIHRIYAQPEGAFRAINVDAMLTKPDVAAMTAFTIANTPQIYGRLKGKAGMFASRTASEMRHTALVNAPALARNLEDYCRERTALRRRVENDEKAARLRAKIPIPVLSEIAQKALEQVRAAIDRGDPNLRKTFSERKDIREELAAFSRSVAQRFGEGTFLGKAARHSDGALFEKITADLTTEQREEVKKAWSAMRTIQQLDTHVDSTTVAKPEQKITHGKSQRLH